jgi:hypothetical protein
MAVLAVLWIEIYSCVYTLLEYSCVHTLSYDNKNWVGFSTFRYWAPEVLGPKFTDVNLVKRLFLCEKRLSNAHG